MDAAGLVLIRRTPDGLRVLLGRRHRRHAFLPGIYVFPGGRLDRADARPSGFAERLPSVRVYGRRQSAAFLRAAIRETYEETGVLVGRPVAKHRASRPGGADAWQAFRSAGLNPAFEALRLVCRAITPTGSARRYHTRFFLADATHLDERLQGNGELEDLAWWPLAETARLGLVDVTQFVLEEALRLWRAGGQAHGPALFSYRGEAAVVRRKGLGPAA